MLSAQPADEADPPPSIFFKVRELACIDLISKVHCDHRWSSFVKGRAGTFTRIYAALPLLIPRVIGAGLQDSSSLGLPSERILSGRVGPVGFLTQLQEIEIDAAGSRFRGAAA